MMQQNPHAMKAAKMGMAVTVSELMPAGKPDYKALLHSPQLSQLAQQRGRNEILKYLCILITDFCSSLNIKRGMSEEQVVEAAIMLLDECGDYRLEDYALMFNLAKRGKLGIELYQSVDILAISQIEQAYDRYSCAQLQAIQQEAEAAQERARLERRKAASKRPLFPARWVIGYEYQQGARYLPFPRHHPKGPERSITSAEVWEMWGQELKKQKEAQAEALRQKRARWEQNRQEMVARYQAQLAAEQIPENAKTI